MVSRPRSQKAQEASIARKGLHKLIGSAKIDNAIGTKKHSNKAANPAAAAPGIIPSFDDFFPPEI